MVTRGSVGRGSGTRTGAHSFTRQKPQVHTCYDHQQGDSIASARDLVEPARLSAWCEGGDHAWLFDNEADLLDIETRVLGFDMTKLLDFTTRYNDAQLATMQKCAPLAGH